MANNLIQIKRSTTTAVPASLANGEFAITSNGDVLYIGSNGAVLPIAGKRVPGTLTANQALVANSTSGIDKIIVANAAISQLNANGSTGTAGQVLKSSGAGGNSYWDTLAAGVAGSDTQVQFNDGGNLAGDAGLTYDKTTDTLSVTGSVLSGATVNAATLQVGTAVVANSTRLAIGSNVGILANGSIGSAGQVLASNGTSVYWITPQEGDITGITAGSGLTGGGSSGDVTVEVGAGNGISVSADAVAVAGANGISVDSTGVNVLAGTDGGLSVNTTGVWVKSGSGLTTNSTGLHIVTTGDSTLIANSTGLYVNDATLSIASSQITGDIALGTNTSGNYVATITAGDGISGSSSSEGGTPTIAVVANNGIVSNSTGVFAKAANGIAVDSSGINVNGGSTLTVNTSGAHVNTNLSITSVTTSGDLTVNGNTKLGDTSSDVISMVASVNTNIMPSANVTYSIGNNTVRWNEIHASNVHSVTGYFDGNVEISGDLIVTGNVTTVNVNSVVVSDPMIYLAGNNYSSDLVDIGLAANYFDGSTNRHTGFFRDATDGVWKLFANSTQELSGNNVVNTTATGYTTAILQSFLNSSGLVTNATHVAINANSTVNVAIVANSLTLSSALATTSGGTGTGTYAVGDLLVGNSSNSLTKLSAGTDGYVLQINGTGVVAWNTLDGGTF